MRVARMRHRRFSVDIMVIAMQSQSPIASVARILPAILEALVKLAVRLFARHDRRANPSVPFADSLQRQFSRICQAVLRNLFADPGVGSRDPGLRPTPFTLTTSASFAEAPGLAVAMSRPGWSIAPPSASAAPKRVIHGQQDVDRRIPSGRNPGGGAPRKPRTGI